MRTKLRDYRISINKSQQAMADSLGVTLSFYKQIECGAKNPSLKTLKKFKTVFPTANTEEIFLT